MISLICLNRIYSNWRGDVGNRIFICLCGATLTLNLAPITLTVITKDTRGRNSAKLFLVAFFGNSCTVLSLIITTALRFDNRLSCTSLKVIYVMFQYGMTLSSYSLLSLVYLNFRLTKTRNSVESKTKGSNVGSTYFIIRYNFMYHAIFVMHYNNFQHNSIIYTYIHCSVRS